MVLTGTGDGIPVEVTGYNKLARQKGNHNQTGSSVPLLWIQCLPGSWMPIFRKSFLQAQINTCFHIDVGNQYKIHQNVNLHQHLEALSLGWVHLEKFTRTDKLAQVFSGFSTL